MSCSSVVGGRKRAVECFMPRNEKIAAGLSRKIIQSSSRQSLPPVENRVLIAEEAMAIESLCVSNPTEYTFFMAIWFLSCVVDGSVNRRSSHPGGQAPLSRRNPRLIQFRYPFKPFAKP